MKPLPAKGKYFLAGSSQITLCFRLNVELQLNQKTVMMNGKSRGRVYSLKADLSHIPETFRYLLVNRIRRVPSAGTTADKRAT
ncbi:MULTISPECIES: hypothetical protein [unclassified Serratia (in: enterobacteria)]|uniref:hypothetical protein n=1 Tax=unclassified Serratia (in: enterobacteria) TaxID=2647522 RepID=UPI001CC1816D|nr:MULTISPECIES: hypothetical protein [unclassified Serratia (in: enterobacteria)]UAN51634.1 hypothetical protein KGP26_00615 [Serratia sp. JSRIV002]UAN57639.1 hypothetical protein KGP21_00615 [Serratia sp. JSRIV004]